MAIDDRDWHRDWLNKKTGYVERARFRMSEADYQRQLLAASRRKRFFWSAVLFFFFLSLLLLPRLWR